MLRNHFDGWTLSIIGDQLCSQNVSTFSELNGTCFVQIPSSKLWYGNGTQSPILIEKVHKYHTSITKDWWFYYIQIFANLYMPIFRNLETQIEETLQLQTGRGLHLKHSWEYRQCVIVMISNDVYKLLSYRLSIMILWRCGYRAGFGSWRSRVQTSDDEDFLQNHYTNIAFNKHHNR